MDFGQLPDHRPFDPRLGPMQVSVAFTAVEATDKDGAALPCIHIGSPQWNVPAWVGKIYPRGTKSTGLLEAYSKQWNAIELNSAFYKIPDLLQVEAWSKKTPDHFRFFVKVFQGLSHDPMAWADARLLRTRMEEFTRTWSTLGTRLGGFFLQLPPDFGADRFGSLERWLSYWPKHLPLSIEFRHTSWFRERQLIAPAFTPLEKNKTGAVITDTPGRRDASHGSVTNDRLFIRFLSQSSPDHSELLPSDLERLENWAEWISRTATTGVKDVAFFIHAPEELWVPELTTHFMGMLETKMPGDLDLTPPGLLLEPQLSLF